MEKIAIYGKGGIGKSTITSSLSAAFAVLGYKVMQIGCDPKADSTVNLLGGQQIVPVMTYLHEHEEYPSLQDIVKIGFGGVCCVEAGGPTPGMGCAGRGILTTFNLLEELDAFGQYQPDIVLYDVLGDVVCGGFAAPIRDGYAEKVMIVTSGEKYALFAARNIYSAVQNFADRHYASVYGVILNRRNVPDEEKYVQAFLDETGVPLLGDIPRDAKIQEYENQNQTVVEGEPDSVIAQTFLNLAKSIAEKENLKPAWSKNHI